MNSGSRSVFLSLVAALALASCSGGGGGSSVTPGGGGTGGTTTGSVAVSPSGLQFPTPSSPPQTFTVSSSASGVTAPVIDSSTCTFNGQQIVTITGGGGTLPATYTVTPNASLQQVPGALPGTYGNCTLVFTSGTNTATLPILVGTNSSGPQTLTATPSSLSFAATNAAAQTFTVTGNGGTGPGTVSTNSSSCAGIAAVSGSGGAPPQTFTVTPIGAGGCAVVVVDGEVSTIVPVTVAQVTQPAAVILTPSSLTFAASNSAPQNVTVSYQGFVGQITVDQSKCTGIATFSIPNGSLPQTGTVTPVAKGTCAITFTPSAAPAVTLSITVQS
ncbi:MAG: hypothetical protein QOI11_3360 [Candidatus Eremiobacteraeota bacterium]|nr:hypothetical protein [Candidatus Eremiobacteraeota bacterium]